MRRATGSRDEARPEASRSTARARLATLMLALLSVGVCLAAAEWAVRRFVEAPFAPSEYRIPDGTLGWSLAPNARYAFAHDGVVLPVAYNAQGFRDVAREVAKRPGVRRIAVLGDSFVEAYSVPLEDALTRRLEARLTRPERPVDVLDFGVGGYGTFQEYLLFRTKVRAYAPDLVLLGFFLGNDVHDNSLEIETYRKPGTRAGERRPFLLPGPGWRTNVVDVEESWALYRRARAQRESGWWRAGEASRLWALTGRAWIASLQEALTTADDDGPRPTREDRRARKALHEAVFSCDTPPEYARAWEITERILARLDAEVAEAGARLVVFSVPAREEMAPADGADARERCLRDLPGWRQLARILERHDIPFVDLRPDFWSASRALHFEQDAHWNAAGHEVAARRLAAEVERLWRQGGGVPSEPEPGAPR